MSEEKQIKANAEPEKQDNPVKKKSTWKRVLLWIIGIFLLIMLICIGLAAWIASSLFDTKPLPEVTKVPDMEKYQSCLSKFQNEILKTQEDTNSLMKDQTIEFSKAEVNAVLDTLTLSARTYLALKLPDTKICDIRFDNGILYADISQKVLFSTPFGQYINMKLEIIPKVANQQIQLNVKSLQAGTMGISGDWVQQHINKEMRKFEQTEDGQMVVATIKGLKLEPDKVYITYNPMQVQMLLTNQLLKLFSDEGGQELNLGNSQELLKILEALQ